MSLTTVNEESTSWLDIVFTDADGVAACPTDITYRIDCLTTNTTIATWTAFTPASSIIEIEVTSDQNAIQTATNDYEKRAVTIKATYGTGDQTTEAHEYQVKNLYGVT